MLPAPVNAPSHPYIQSRWLLGREHTKWWPCGKSCLGASMHASRCRCPAPFHVAAAAVLEQCLIRNPHSSSPLPIRGLVAFSLGLHALLRMHSAIPPVHPRGALLAGPAEFLVRTRSTGPPQPGMLLLQWPLHWPKRTAVCSGDFSPRASAITSQGWGGLEGSLGPEPSKCQTQVQIPS